MKRERKLNRKRKYDYNSPGSYFVTINTKNGCGFFGEVKNSPECRAGGKMVLSEYGKIVEKIWREIPKHFDNTDIDQFVIMPNHIHGIIIVYDTVGNNDRCSLQNTKSNRNMELIPKIISQYKSSVTRTIRKQFNDFEFAWQKSYYDRIICNENELNRIREYIYYNPRNWKLNGNDYENDVKLI